MNSHRHAPRCASDRTSRAPEVANAGSTIGTGADQAPIGGERTRSPELPTGGEPEGLSTDCTCAHIQSWLVMQALDMWADVFNEGGMSIAETDVLVGAGATWRSLKAAVDNGNLIRARRGQYALPRTDRHIIEAVRLGGRLGCISAAAHEGIFVFDNSLTHIHVEPTSSRLRAPHDRFQRLSDENKDGVVLHWSRLQNGEDVNDYRIGLRDALIQILRCQEPRFALASLDSALHQGLVLFEDIPGIFSSLPHDLQWLRTRIDARADTGQETVLRFILIDAGFAFEFQPTIPGAGRVDTLVEGCVVVEADSRQYHDGWEAHSRDRTRDCELAMQGYMSYRALYRDIMFRPDRVVRAVTGLLAASRHYRVILH
jgi:very-short-patch-repair endonuclease